MQGRFRYENPIFTSVFVSGGFCQCWHVNCELHDSAGKHGGGYYVGYTGATVDGVAQNLLCDDMLHTTGVPSGPFTYNVSTLPDLADVRFTGLANYETAAVLLWEFDNSNQTDAGGYNFALWNIFDPAAGSDGDSAALLANAQSIVANGGIFAAYQDTACSPQFQVVLRTRSSCSCRCQFTYWTTRRFRNRSHTCCLVPV